MLNNYINKKDFLDLINKGPQIVSRLFRKITQQSTSRVQEKWSLTEYHLQNWWDIPEIRKRWNKMITGNENTEYYEYVSKKYFEGRENLLGLSLGCGTGHRELKWADQRKFKSITAIDLSKSRIESAVKEAQVMGYDEIIKYQVANINNLDFPESYFDVIFVEQSLHHFSPLKVILKKIKSAIKPDGFFIINEYVGPTRFQWTEKQLEVVNGLLSILPKRYKLVAGNSSEKKSRVYRPSKLRMILRDPSEAVESSNIVPFVTEMFEILEVVEYGGTILQLLFSEIAQNFISSQYECKRWLKIYFEIEDLLLMEKELNSDFIFIVCKK
jgi:ubiquinone/menaquinone biosynthesis C-methylase UbiE